MRIVFIGCVTFSRNALLKLLELNANIVGVITKEKSTFNSDFCDLSKISINQSIPYKYVNDINHPNNIEWIQTLKPDIIFCFGWSSIIKKELLDLSKYGIIGFHPALLPNNRGRHPLIWAKVLGLHSTGSTFFFMDSGADTGDILDQVEFKIHFEDDINHIYLKMTSIALNQIEYFFPKLLKNKYYRRKQPNTGNTWRKRSKNDGLIDFRMHTKSICNLVRALTKPFPGAHLVIENSEYKIWKVEPGFNNDQNIEPGKIISLKENIIEIKTGDKSIYLIEHELPNLKVGTYI